MILKSEVFERIFIEDFSCVFPFVKKISNHNPQQNAQQFVAFSWHLFGIALWARNLNKNNFENP